MRTLVYWSYRSFLVLGLTLLLAAHGVAQQRGASGGTFLNMPVDKEVRSALVKIINRGAELYTDKSDFAGCLRLYQGALMAIRPMLKGHGDLQKSIDQALVEAATNPDPEKSAFTLHKMLKKVHDELRASAGKGTEKKASTSKSGEKTATEKKAETKKGTQTTAERKSTDAPSLWKRLGGEDAVRQVVDDFVKSAAADKKLDFTRGGKYKLDEPKLKNALVEMISGVTGGPLRYTGPDMKEAHKGMHITNKEFDRAIEHLKRVLKKRVTSREAARELLKIVEKTRALVVEAADSDKKAAKAAPGGTLAGRITYKGKPVAGGTVTLRGEGGRSYQATINADGTYALEGAIPPGEYRVTVEGDSSKPGGKAALPARYAKAESSALRVIIAARANVSDFALP